MDEDPASSVLLEGWLLRESTYVSHVVNRRYAVLCPKQLITYRRKGDHSTAKAWHLNHRSRVEAPGKKMFNQIKGGAEKSLWAAISNQSVPELLHYITLATSHGHATLAFTDTEECSKWFIALAGALEALHQVTLPASTNVSVPSTPRKIGSSSSQLSTPLDRSQYEGLRIPGDPANPRSRRPSFQDESARLHHSSRSNTQSSLLIEADASIGPNPQHIPRAFSFRGRAQRGQRHKWKPYTYVNGVSVFLENPDAPSGEAYDPSFMTSIVVGAPPELCIQEALAMGLAEDVSDVDPRSNAGNGGGGGAAAASSAAADDKWGQSTAGTVVLERPDLYTDVIMETWGPPPWLGLLVARRELILRRSWRKEDDGTLVMVYSTTTHSKAPPTRDVRWWHWWAPIRAHAEAGLTFSPQLPVYTHNGASTQCLVTQVVKVNLGGWLGNPGARARRLLMPTLFVIGSSFLSRVVRAAVVLREHVEHELFVARPFAMGPDPSAATDSGHITIPDISRSATFYITRAQRATTGLFQLGSGEVRKPIPGTLREGVASGDGAQDDEPALAEEPDTFCPTGTLEQRFWSCPGAAGYKLRGGNYLKDHKKVEAENPVFDLASVDLIETDKPCFHIAQHLPAIKFSMSPFSFVVNIMVPASPPLHLCAAWAMDAAPKLDHTSMARSEANSSLGGEADSDAEADKASPFDIALARFVAGGDGPEATAHRNGAFKLIPHIVQGSWIVKQSVGETPVLLGRKLTTHYFKGPNYFEVDVDVSSSSVAKHVVGLVCGATKTITVDLGILLQGNQADELPEALLGTLRLVQIDLSTATHLDVKTGKLTPKQS